MRANWIIAAVSAFGVAAGASAVVLGPLGVGAPEPAAAGVVDLSWDDLIPEQTRTATQRAMDALRAAAAEAPLVGSGFEDELVDPPGSGPVSPLTGAPIASADPVAPRADSRGLQGVIPHAGASQLLFSPETGLVRDFDGRQVRLPGYIVPLDFDGERTSKFLLVPFIGACIHVPPPPANQIVYVETEEPYRIAEFFEAVYAEGVMTANVETTELAEVGYRIDAKRIRPYQ